MSRRVLDPAIVERHDDGGLSAVTLAALEREAAHLTRRDGQRRLIVLWDDDTPGIETDHGLDNRYGPRILATVDIA